MPQGIDISHQNGPINWGLLSPQIQFVYCKASQGANFRDPLFKTYQVAIKKKKLITGAYHFLTFQSSAQMQADNFMASGFDFGASGTLPPAIDLEWQEGKNATETSALNQYIKNNRSACIALISEFLELINQKTGRTPIIYTAKEFMAEFFLNTTMFGTYPLWIPAYQNAKPGLPSGWQKDTIWQYTGSGEITGVSGKVDQDLFRGTREELHEFALY